MISVEQAQNFALLIKDQIADYCREHETEYRAYLLATGQVDNDYPPEPERESVNNISDAFISAGDCTIK